MPLVIHKLSEQAQLLIEKAEASGANTEDLRVWRAFLFELDEEDIGRFLRLTDDHGLKILTSIISNIRQKEQALRSLNEQAAEDVLGQEQQLLESISSPAT